MTSMEGSLIAINTSSAPKPVGPYNQAVLAGEWLYCSGQIALEPNEGFLVGNGDIDLETKQVLKNLEAVLNKAGATNSQVVRTTIYLTDLNDFNRVNKIYSETFTGIVFPSRACVEVSALPKGARVEIDCVAWLGQGT